VPFERGWIDSSPLLSGGKPTMATVIAGARMDELAPGQGKLVEVNQKRIALFHVGGHYDALDGMCPHRGLRLSDK
jgi:3-phenylpropionate/trans-cinnamate dioxygenase ferredoxin component